MAIFERNAKALSRAETGPHVEVLWHALLDLDHDHFLTRRHVRIFEPNTDTGEHSERRHALLGLTHQAALVEPTELERDAAPDQALARALGAVHHDARHAHLLSLADDEAQPSACV